MNRIAFFLIAALLLVLSGCDAKDQQSRVESCKSAQVTIISTARGQAQFAILKVVPRKVHVCPGGRITLKFQPERVLNAVSTKPQGSKHLKGSNPGSDGWLNAENKNSKNEMFIDVPPEAKLGVYKYSVSVDGVGTLDPHAEVIPNK